MSDPTRPAQRRSGGPGGSSQTIPSRRPSVRESRSALDRAKDTLGADVVNDLEATDKTLSPQWGGEEHSQAEGMVLALLHQGVPDAQVRAIFGVGGPR
ncbi:hypothetical protein JG687_00005737 [Phytophthora cactorum]|uniref:Uncharacterized protein n=1 Tax=Phytophthora cactorum TaxID=29920 RepID=A0A8T1UPI4_9STRA|nr:hypothetical protein GQ600_25663 [Phytophthora cactorum]KAG2786917.1 hypothetical protein Pcac1_g4006 [Phytophthora cactorum]KAG2903754.1 hypothetical protein PC114_g12135 [Phytophthora cactorum]KAG2937093.1 hypothetical protein PC117_g11853 [Phytophthora cactorum]KAG3164828.1 hypothetical protein C6341_g12542 [Phytophthora cactorum]